MTTCEKDDIVLVPFPFSDQSASKKRSAVVISSDTYNNISSDVTFCKKNKISYHIKEGTLVTGKKKS